MKRYGIALGTLVLAVLIVWAIGGFRLAKAPGGAVACTAEAKLCPDGSYVGRTGPNCDFAECPGSVATTTGSTVGGGGSILPYHSGVQGTVSLGPTCPVMREPPDPQCADKPYATAIVAYRTGSTAPYIMGNSDQSGAFTLPLPPGSYTLSAGGSAMLPRCAPVDVTVTKGAYVTTAISCDTGIR